MADRRSVLVVDDSAYMRVVLKDMLEADPTLHVVSTAKDGLEAIDKVKKLHPDVVVLDIQMPKMDGLATLQRIMRECPTRVVMLSAMDRVDPQLPLQALDLGAVDFISKPGGPVSVDIVIFGSRIVEIVRNSAEARVDALTRTRPPSPHKLHLAPPKPTRGVGRRAIVVAASTGGPKTLEAMFSALPRNINIPIFIVQHLPEGFSESFAKRLTAARGPKVVLAVDGDEAKPGMAYLAPGDRHLVLEAGRTGAVTMRLQQTEPVNYVRPSADVLFTSASKCFGANLLAVVLTGMGSDGARGAEAVKSAGGRVVVQDEASSVIFGMARAVVGRGAADKVLPMEDIPLEIVSFMEG